jgi:hypothetical protein
MLEDGVGDAVPYACEYDSILHDGACMLHADVLMSLYVVQECCAACATPDLGWSGLT